MVRPVSRDLARYIVRAVRWEPVVLGVAAGAAFLVIARVTEQAWTTSALLFAATAVAAAVGLAIDDPAAETMAGVPTALWLRAIRSAAVSVTVAAASWGAMMLLVRDVAPVAQWTVMAASLWCVGLAVAGAAKRRLGPTAGGIIAAPVVPVVALASTTMSGQWSLVPGGAGVAWRWGVIAALAAALLAWSLRDPARGGR